MKTNKTDLDIDFIGGLGSLTETEEKDLSDFFKSRKNLVTKISRKQSQIKDYSNELAEIEIGV